MINVSDDFLVKMHSYSTFDSIDIAFQPKHANLVVMKATIPTHTHTHTHWMTSQINYVISFHQHLFSWMSCYNCRQAIAVKLKRQCFMVSNLSGLWKAHQNRIPIPANIYTRTHAPLHAHTHIFENKCSFIAANLVALSPISFMYFVSHTDIHSLSFKV